MAVYKISDIASRIVEMLGHGAIYTDVVRKRSGALSFSVATPEYLYPVESVEPIEVSDYGLLHEVISPSDSCYACAFSYQELFSILNALDRAIYYLNLCKDDPDITENELAEIKRSSSDYQNLLSKILSYPQIADIVSSEGANHCEGKTDR